MPAASRKQRQHGRIESAERVEKGVPLTPELDQALFHGSSIGGAHPKALIQDRGKLPVRAAIHCLPIPPKN